MPRPGLLLLCSLAAAVSGGLALESASRAGAQTAGAGPGPGPAPSWNNTSWLNAERPLAPGPAPRPGGAAQLLGVHLR